MDVADLLRAGRDLRRTRPHQAARRLRKQWGCRRPFRRTADWAVCDRAGSRGQAGAVVDPGDLGRKVVVQKKRLQRVQVGKRPLRLILQMIDERAQHLQTQDLGLVCTVDAPGFERRAARQVEVR